MRNFAKNFICLLIFLSFFFFNSGRILAADNEVVFRGASTGKKIAITFDADMTPSMKKRLQAGIVTSWYNKAVIDELRATHTPATLFLTGMWAELYPSVTKELAADPLFEIGNHTYSHPAFAGHCYGLARVPQSQKEEQITQTQEILRGLTGAKPKLFRFPGGCYRSNDVLLAQQLHLQVIQWDIASNDAFNSKTAAIVTKVLRQAHGGSIIVFHMHGGPNAPKTADALKVIIPSLKKRGFEFVKVGEMIR